MIVVLLFGLALLTGQPAAAGQALPDADPAARMAVGAFAFGCLERLNFATSATDYAAKSTELGEQLKTQAGAFADKFRFEGVGGDTCRITYRGPNVTTLWTALTDFKINAMNNPCTEQHPSPDKAVLTCAANANPAYVQTVERRGQGADAQLTAALTYRGPAIPGASTAVIPPR